MVSPTLHCWDWSARFVLSLVIMTWSTPFTEAGDCPAEDGWTCRSLSASVTCTSGRNVEITAAYYVNVADRTLCDENCTATQNAKPSQCKTDIGHCHQKMDQDGLGSVYATCNAKLSYCDLRNVRLPEPFVNSNVYVEHTCISETERVDPCRLPSLGTSTNASVLLLDYCSSCNGTCEISPINSTKPFRFKYSFLPKGSPEQDPDKIAEYKLVLSDESIECTWTPLYRASYREFRNLKGVQKLQIRFQMSNPANMTRLWISFYDLDVSIACNTSKWPVVSSPSVGSSSETTASTFLYTATNSGNVTSTMSDDSGFRFSAESLAVGFAAGILVTAGIVVVIVFCKRRERRYQRPLPRREEPAHYTALNAAFPRRNVTSGASSTIYLEILDEPQANVDSEGYSHVPMPPPTQGTTTQQGSSAISASATLSDDYLHPAASTSGMTTTASQSAS
ncbi:hypothetical protein BaRGS_00020972 [Batillaria attramentaria]|uniref:Uncharacterized protein n=1 Tax=Batillaria attramentaria TaxID=370345 RepID=A0ABD0KLL4_9CAEN